MTNLYDILMKAMALDKLGDLTKEGFNVKTYIHGLGENANIRGLYVDRATEALDALQK